MLAGGAGAAPPGTGGPPAGGTAPPLPTQTPTWAPAHASAHPHIRKLCQHPGPLQPVLTGNPKYVSWHTRIRLHPLGRLCMQRCARAWLSRNGGASTMRMISQERDLALGFMQSYHSASPHPHLAEANEEEEAPWKGHTTTQSRQSAMTTNAPGTTCAELHLFASKQPQSF